MTFRSFALAAVLAALPVAPLVSRSADAQAPTAPATRTAQVFLDCEWECDQDYIRTEITYVEWVRERTVADVHLLVTTQATGGSGREFTLTFIGQRAFSGMTDTLRYIAPTTNSEDDTRRGVTRTIALGLARYVARTDAAARYAIAAPTARAQEEAAAATPGRDPWNFWTFNINGNTYFNGEQSYESRDYYMRVSANRTTAQWKTRIGVSQNQSSNRFVIPLDDAGTDTAITSFRRSLSADGLLVKSVGGRLSAGLRMGVSSNTYVNQQVNLFVLPAVEYNLFPYAESTRRSLTLQYGIGTRSFRYVDTTVYGRTRETKPIQSVEAELGLRQPWGSIGLTIGGQQYLDSPKNYTVSSWGNADVRLFKGFSVNLWGGYERIRDQIYLRAVGATREEILTRQRQLETGYSFNGGIGLRYTFGSIFNSVVNPRFD